MKPMRVVVSAVFMAAMGAGGVAVAQAPAHIQGQPVVSHMSYTVEPYAPPGAAVTIQGTGVRLRAEPFSTPQTPVMSSGSTGLALNIVGIARLPDWNWYQVVLKNGQKAFIRSDLTSAPSRGNGQAAPIAATPVAAVPAPTPVAAAPMPAAPVVTSPPVSTYTPTPPPTPQPYVPPVYSQPVPAPQPVPLAPATTQTQIPAVSNSLPSLDLPKPSDPPGLRSN